MTDREALFAAIRDNPAQDAPRLVFADWLDEYGTELDRMRAHFIRDTIRRGATRKKNAGVVRVRIVPYYHNRLGLVWSAFSSPMCPKGASDYARAAFPTPPAALHTALYFSGGFLTHLWCPFEWWRAHAASLRHEQLIDTVNLTTFPRNSIGSLISINAEQHEWHGIELVMPWSASQSETAHLPASTTFAGALSATNEMLEGMGAVMSQYLQQQIENAFITMPTE